MASCLGLYIEDNIIKYAKVSKDRNDLKIESFGIRVYEDLVSEINNIVEETYSFGVPVSINLMNEQYVYFNIFSLLNAKDLKTSIKTELETFCDEKKYNVSAFETRYALVQDFQNKDQLRTIDILSNKIELNRQIQNLSKYKLTNIMPLPMSITNLAKFEKNENALIVNMEEKTTITVILNSQIYSIETLDAGSKKVLQDINKIENSYSKAYDICKNTTIYTADIGNEDDNQPYLQYIVPTLYDINQEIQRILEEYDLKSLKVYLTGTLANINNVDLYFQEFLPNATCKILKPNFLNDINTQINLKDYLEVNSAISLALSGLGEGIKGLNFKKVSLKDKLAELSKIEVKPNKNKEKGKVTEKKSSKINIQSGFNDKVDNTETMLIRGMGIIALIIIIFISFSTVLKGQMNAKEEQIDNLKAKQQAQLSSIDGDNQKLNSKITKYSSMIADLEKINERISDIASSKNSVPNLLNQIMFVIPEAVQLTSIENTNSKHIVINAQSAKYEQLGYFIAKIKEKGYLLNVVSSSGAKSSEMISVTIEGDMP